MIQGKILSGLDDISPAIAIRREVFVQEQGFSADSEPDCHDRDAMHVVLNDDIGPVGTGRMFYDENGNWRIGRLAVLKRARGQHLGDLLMRIMLDRLLRSGAKEVVLDAQMYAVPFYRKYGFVDTGRHLFDEGCEHACMKANAEEIRRLVFSGCGDCDHDCAHCAEKRPEGH